MDVNDLKGLYAEARKRMDGYIEHVRRDLAGVRTGRASTGLLENVMVEAYGAKMPLNQVATLSIPEPSLIVAQPFDPSTLASLERAIRLSDLGLNPSTDGKVIRIPIPSLTEERRKELSRHAHRVAEEGRNQIRTVRREANDRLKKFLKESADLGGRREARPRRSAKDHRPLYSARSTTCSARRTRTYWASDAISGWVLAASG